MQTDAGRPSWLPPMPLCDGVIALLFDGNVLSRYRRIDMAGTGAIGQFLDGVKGFRILRSQMRLSVEIRFVTGSAVWCKGRVRPFHRP